MTPEVAEAVKNKTENFSEDPRKNLSTFQSLLWSLNTSIKIGFKNFKYLKLPEAFYKILEKC